MIEWQREMHVTKRVNTQSKQSGSEKTEVIEEPRKGTSYRGRAESSNYSREERNPVGERKGDGHFPLVSGKKKTVAKGDIPKKRKKNRNPKGPKKGDVLFGKRGKHKKGAPKIRIT